MPSERTQRQIDRLLDEAEQAMAERDWASLREHAQDVLLLDADNEDAQNFLRAAERALADSPTPPEPILLAPFPAGEGGTIPSGVQQGGRCVAPEEHSRGGRAGPPAGRSSGTDASEAPTAFANGRYAVKKFLGEGGKKKVYLAHDTLLDRDVAFALIKTEGLDQTGRDRITREAQAMGRLGAHPHIVSVFDLGTIPAAAGPHPGPLSPEATPTAPILGEGDERGQPYIVTELMGGGDVEGLIEKAPEHRPPLERTLEIGMEVCRGLEFAHAHSIVHRDLKPGNVWLTAQGTAKLGDFGLAVALDKTRLTQAGMMVGTVSYMPPEQAMGGEVTPRSDLYSLGAMLYEMVCGRPPFVGDESVAIITQHLNAQPVAPSWHNAAVPPALEALILRLLEKDPAKRPGSAADVREALSRIQPGSQQAAVAAASAAVPAAADQNPIYRRAFVGREQELRQLQTAYDAAASGQGSLVMVVGEPGIGKTSLCEQLATHAIVYGGKALVGHCYEEGSLSLPYLPFVEAMRSYVLSREPDALRKDLGTGAGEVARIVSDVRERLHVEPSVSTGDAEEERYRLYQAVTSFLRNAATVQPIVLVLEDLHDADRGTLDLLLHLSRNLSGARLLIVGTYRDIEVDRAHPLSATLAELRRSASFGRVLLRGLTADEVQRMLSQLSGQEISWGLAEAVHRQTEGNPLFIQEVLRYIVEEGLVRREDGRWRRVSGEAPLELGIPEGLRDVIGKRLARLSPECNRLLAVASVIGRDFTLATVQRVTGQTAEEISGTLDEAVRTAVLTEQERVGEVQYHFAHAFFRQTLYEELGAARRIQLHQQVARALEDQHAARLQDHAAELAEHFAHSSDHADLTKAVRYAGSAAERAMSVYAYGQAVRHLEQALDVQEVLDPDDKTKRCDLLLALGEAILPGEGPRRAADRVAPEALALAERIADRQRCGRACVLALAALVGVGGGPVVATPEFGHWLELADRYCQPASAEQIRADLWFGLRETFLGRGRAGLERFQRALNHARALGDDPSVCEAASSLVFTKLTDFQAERRRLLDELADYHFAGVSAQRLAQFLCFSGLAFLAFGDRVGYERQRQRLLELAERTKASYARLCASRMALWALAIDGRLEDLLHHAEEHLRLAGELDALEAGRSEVFFNTERPLCYLGRAEEALAGQPDSARRAAAEGRSLVWAADTTLILAHLGRWTDVAPYFDQIKSSLRNPETADELGYSALAKFLEAAVLAQDRELVALVRPHLEPLAAMVNEHFLTTNARHLGAAAALLGEPEQAMRYYEQALEVAAKIGFRYEIALTHLGIAELLLEDTAQSKHVEALEHLDFAIAEFRDMKMQPALERALRHKEVLKA